MLPGNKGGDKMECKICGKPNIEKLQGDQGYRCPTCFTEYNSDGKIKVFNKEDYR
jgi:hypothetical protein